MSPFTAKEGDKSTELLFGFCNILAMASENYCL